MNASRRNATPFRFGLKVIISNGIAADVFSLTFFAGQGNIARRTINVQVLSV